MEHEPNQIQSILGYVDRQEIIQYLKPSDACSSSLGSVKSCTTLVYITTLFVVLKACLLPELLHASTVFLVQWLTRRLALRAVRPLLCNFSVGNRACVQAMSTCGCQLKCVNILCSSPICASNECQFSYLVILLYSLHRTMRCTVIKFENPMHRNLFAMSLFSSSLLMAQGFLPFYA